MGAIPYANMNYYILSSRIMGLNNMCEPATRDQPIMLLFFTHYAMLHAVLFKFTYYAQVLDHCQTIMLFI